MQGTLYDQLGGEAKLRQIIDTFIDRVFEDRMIGFFFRNADRKRIKEMELQLTARFLGADVEYVPRHIRDAWLEHSESLRPLTTKDAGSDCDAVRAQEKVQRASKGS